MIGHIGYSPDYKSKQENNLVKQLKKWEFRDEDIQRELDKCIHVRIGKNTESLKVLNGGLKVSSGEKILVYIQANGCHDYFFYVIGA